MRRSAVFSPCRQWRYTLERYWGDGPVALFVLLNPSTADERVDDATNRRGIAFAKRWGFDGCVFVNLFAWRSRDPRCLKTVVDPIGEHNDTHIASMACQADQIVVAWGTQGSYLNRDASVLSLLYHYEVFCLGRTKDGHPKHPLYLRSGTRLEAFRP